uniref:Integrase n=1 Tax=Parastrongyloides trichosuri TaxID=131310 RepID=A0A0N4ZS23_PARTI
MSVLINKRTKIIGNYPLHPKQGKLLKFEGDNQRISIDWNKSAIIVEETVKKWLIEAENDYNKPTKSKIIEALRIIEKNGYL